MSSRDSSSPAEALADLSFAVFLIAETLFSHTTAGQVGLVFFGASCILLTLERDRVHASFFFGYMLLFTAYAYAHTALGMSLDSETSRRMVGTLVVNCIVGLLFYNYMIVRGDFDQVLRVFMWACVAASALGLLILGSSLSTGRLSANASVLGDQVDLNPNTLGMLAAYAFLATLFTSMKKKSAAYFGVLAWCIIVVLLSGSRKSLLAVVVGAFILAFLSSPKGRTRVILGAVISTSLLYQLVIYSPVLYSVIGYRLEAVIDYFQGASFVEGSLSSRTAYIELGWKAFLERPWTGYGLDCFRLLQGAYGTYSHNNYIELLVSVGLVGTAIFYLPYIVSLRLGFKARTEGRVTADLGIALFVVILFTDYSMVSYFDRLTLLVAMMALVSIGRQGRRMVSVGTGSKTISLTRAGRR